MTVNDIDGEGLSPLLSLQIDGWEQCSVHCHSVAKTISACKESQEEKSYSGKSACYKKKMPCFSTGCQQKEKARWTPNPTSVLSKNNSTAPDQIQCISVCV